MNKGRYRVIFNKATGVFAAVSELAKRHAKSTTSGEYVGGVSAISGFFARFNKVALCIALLCNGVNLVSAQIVADPNAGNQPTVTTTPNNVPNVHIVAPNAAGVSHNQYQKFNVQQQGAILSNNPNAVNTQLGGNIAANPNLQHSGAARVIVNEVTSTHKTELRGYLEVAGQKADVVISNPNGIKIGNFSFINAQRGVLTTGTPMFGGTGSLDAFRVEQGTITVVQSNKLKNDIIEQTDLIARSVQINGEIWANQLNVVTGSNKVNYADLGVTVIEGKGGKPQVAIDVGVMGGMYANKINLVGTEAGVGVNNYGEMVSHVNNVQLQNNGRIDIGGITTAQQNVIIRTTGDITNHVGGVVYARGDVDLHSDTDIDNMGLITADHANDVVAKNIHNDGRIYGDTIKLTASGKFQNGKATATDLAAGVVVAHDTLTLAANEVNNQDGALLLTEDGTLKIHGAHGANTQVAKVTNASAKIDAGSDLVINAKELNNTNTHYKTGKKTEEEHVVEYVVNGKTYTSDKARIIDNGRYQEVLYTDNATANINDIWNGAATSKNYSTNDYKKITTKTVIEESKPGELIARGDMTLSGKVTNDKSVIAASGEINGDIESLDNIDNKGSVVVRGKGTNTYHTTGKWWWIFGTEKNKFSSQGLSIAISEETIDLLHAKKTEHDGALKKSTIPVDNNVDYLLSKIDSQLFHKAGSDRGYLIETEPAFINQANYISSAYLLKALGLTDKKHLGDGYYEQKMVMEQIIQQTGRRDLLEGTSTKEQYKFLMDSALMVQEKLNLKAGEALTQDQQKTLTTDIVWMVSKTIKLTNEKSTEVLLPVVYLAHKKRNNMPTTTGMMTAKNIVINAKNSIQNSGLIAADHKLTMTSGQDIANMYGEIRSEGGTGTVNLDAKGHVSNTSASISGATIAVKAGKDVVIATNQKINTGENGTNINLDRAGKVEGGNVTIAAGNDLVTHAANLFSAGDLVLDAQNRLELGALTTRQEFNIGGADNHDNDAKEQTNGTQIQGKGDITLHGKQGITTQAANVESNQKLSVSSDGNVVIGDATQHMLSDSKSIQADNGLLSIHYKQDSKKTSSETSEGSSLSGDRVEITSGKDVSVGGSEIVASRDLSINAKNNIAITTGKNVYTKNSSHEESTAGLTLEGGGINIGIESTENQQDFEQVTHNSSTVGSLVGNVMMKAGKHFSQSGSNVIANKGYVNIAAQKVDIVHATETTDGKQQNKTQKVGISAGVTSSLVTALQDIKQTVSNYKKTKNVRAQVLAAITARSQVYDLVKNLIVGGEFDAGVSVGASITASHSKQHDSAVKRSVIKAGGNVTITAKGDRKNSDVSVIGSDIEAGGNTYLQADNSVGILAGKNTHSSHSYNKNLGGSVGYSVLKGWNGSVSAGRGMSDGDSVNQTNSHVKSGKQMTFASGGNTTISGGVVSGTQVTANVGGDMFIESLQDKSTYSSLQQGVGVEITQNLGGSVSASQSTANGTFAGVAEQSGIKAGDGGFTVNVKGNTDLKGAVIASSDKAVNDGKNSLTTGTLTASDIHNYSEADTNSKGVSIDTGKGLYGVMKGGAGALMTQGNANDSDNSDTKSVISGGASVIRDTDRQLEKNGKTAEETIASMNRDTEYAHVAVRKIDAEKMQEQAQADHEIKNQFFKQATKYTTDLVYTADHAPMQIRKGEEVVDISKVDIQADKNGKVHLFNHGIFNDKNKAVNNAYKQQGDDKIKQKDVYTIINPYAGNAVAEGLYVALDKTREVTGLFGILGISNASKATVVFRDKVAEQNARNGGTGKQISIQENDHSRGSLTSSIATQYQAQLGQKNVPIENIQFNGAAANAERMKGYVDVITGRKGAVYQSTHENDFVGTLFGGNAVTSSGTGKDVPFSKVHSSYGIHFHEEGKHRIWGSQFGSTNKTGMNPTSIKVTIAKGK